MGARDRAANDRAAGDLGTAKRRLASLLDTTGYDPGVCRELAEICLDMRDPIEAGRWVYLCEDASDSPNDAAREAMAAFVGKCRNDPATIAGRLPRFVKTTRSESLPEPVQARLEAIGLPRPVGAATVHASGRVVGRLGTLGCLTVLGLFVASAIVGFIVIVQTVFGLFLEGG